MLNFSYFKTCYTKINVINKLQNFYHGVRGNNKFGTCAFYKLYHSTPKRAINVTNLRCEVSKLGTAFLEANTNVQNNVFLYKLESNYYLHMRYIALASLGFSAMMCYFSYDPSLLKIFTTNISLKYYLKTNLLNIMYFLYGSLVGPLICCILYISAKRSVKYIILHKGGEEVYIITHHLFKNQVVMKLPTNEVQSIIARKDMKMYLPLKIKGKSFFYLMDGTGSFINGRLFDNTVGTAKDWRK